MDKVGVAIEKLIADSLVLHKESFIIPALIPETKIEYVLQNMLAQNPELFFVNGFKLKYSYLSTTIYPSYICSKSESDEILYLCRRKARQLTDRCQGPGDYSKVLQAHDLLARNVVYKRGSSQELHTIVGSLINKQGVCEGFAKALKYLLDIMSIPSVLVYGYGYTGNAGNKEAHTWNLVRFGNDWIHVDVTFDTTIRNGQALRYDYFGLSDNQILKDHEFDLKKYPAALKTDYEFYLRNGLVMYTKKQMNAFVSNALHDGRQDVIFKLPGKSCDEKILQIIIDEIQNLLEQQRINVQYTVDCNLSQGVFHINFNY